MTDLKDALVVEVPIKAPVAGPEGAAPAVATTSRGRFAGMDYKWMALGVVLLGSIMTILDATIVNIAIPTLQRAFSVTSYTDITWVITGYLLAQGAVIPLAGWATDRWGTKRLYIATLVLFTLASMLCGVAWSLPSLIFFRVLQGLGGGMVMPIGMTILLGAVGPRQMGKMMGVFGVPMLLGPALGPVLGGWFVQDFSWRLIFYVNVPIGVVAVITAVRVLRETPRAHKLRLDVVGALTALPAVLALLYAVDRSNDLGWGSPLVVGLLVASVAFLVAFIVRQLSAAEPLLQLQLFRDGTFSWAMVLMFIIVTGLFGGMLLVPIFLQQAHGYGALETGLLLLPQAGTAALFMPVGGYLVDRFGPRPVVMTGLVALTASSVLLAQLHADSSFTLLIGALMLRGAAMGMSMMPTMSAALARVPARFQSRASSITNTLQRVSSSIGIAVLVTILSAQVGVATTQVTCAPSAQVLTEAHAPNAQVFCTRLSQQFADATRNHSPTSPAAAPAATRAFISGYSNSALSISFDRTFAFIAMLTVLGLIPAWFLRRPERDAASAGSAVAAA